MGAGIGGHVAHVPSSYVVSKFNRKNGTTSVYPAFVTVFFPHALNIAAARSASGDEGVGADGKSANAAMVEISEWK